MRIRHRIAVMALVVLASAGTLGANYIHGNAIAQRDAVAAYGREPGPVNVRYLPSPRLHVLPAADGDDTVRQKKTLALLVLMLREGPGAR
jgi:hypothetical protein